jgi:2',3'-cyclic-nucleotide 2'-phosphodiesterase/3'-nucleotidase
MLTFKNMQKFIAKLSLIFLFIAASLSAQTINLKIIQTTDDHGAIFPYDFTDQRTTNNSLAHISTILKKERANKDQEIILLNGGDILQGTPAVYYYNFEKPEDTHLLAEVMNYMNYDAGVVGNHDIETGHPVYDKFVTEINFPWLAANAINKTTNAPYFKPYTIIERKGIKIAVLGLITPHIPNWLPEKIWEGIDWKDMIESAEKWVKIIKENEKPDLLVGLFHAGVDYTYGNQNENSHKNENASQLVAQKVDGLDIVFVGHDHKGWNFNIKNDAGNEVLILGGTSYGRDLAIAECVFTFDDNSKSWKKLISGATVESKNFQPDSVFLSKFESQFKEVKQYVTRTIGSFENELDARESIFGSSAFSDFINQIQMEITGADISFTAPLSLNAKIDKGEISVGQLFKLYRYENLLYTMNLTGKEIKNYLEHSYSLWFNQIKNENDNLLNFVKDDSGNTIFDKRNNAPQLKFPFYNFDSALGIDYEVDVTKPDGEKIKIISMRNGLKFDENKIYKTAINSYRGNGGGGHLLIGSKIPKEELSSRIISSTDKDLRYYIMKWIEKNKTITPIKYSNWQVVPQSLWERAKERDYKLLFNN